MHIKKYKYMGNIYIHTDILMRKILRKGWSFVLMETLEWKHTSATEGNVTLARK